MAIYGAIPPSSPPPSLDFISCVKHRSQFALSSLRPWGEMIQTHAFSLPLSLSDVYLRIRTNTAYFSINYAIIFLFFAFLGLFFYPIAFLVFLFVVASWMSLFIIRDQPLVIYGRKLEESYILIGLSVVTIWLLCLSVVTILLLLITDSALNIAGSVFSGVFAVLNLAVLRRTDDLAVDEETAAAGGWYAVAGENNRTSPVS